VAGPKTLATLRGMLSTPQGTFHALKAVLALLGRQPEGFATWKRAYGHLTPQLFEDMKNYDATQVGLLPCRPVARLGAGSAARAVEQPELLSSAAGGQPCGWLGSGFGDRPRLRWIVSVRMCECVSVRMSWRVALQARDMEVWKRVRSCYKAVTNAKKLVSGSRPRRRSASG
jgi:hypothetical protein